MMQMRHSWTQLLLFGFLLSAICVFNLNLNEVQSNSPEILYIGENSDDLSLLLMLDNELDYSGRIIDIRTSENLNEFFLAGEYFSSHSIIILSVAQVTNPFNETLITNLEEYVARGGTFFIISSQIWKFPSAFHDLLELEIEEISLKEWPVGNASTEISLRILNDTYTSFPYNFGLNTKFNVTGRIGVANTTNINYALANSSYTPEGNTYINVFRKGSGLIGAIPLSIVDQENSTATFSQYLTSLLSTENLPPEFLPPPSSEPELIIPLLNISEETIEVIVGASILITTFSAVAYAATQIGRSTALSTSTSILPDRNILWNLLLTPIIFIGHVLYPPIIRRLDEEMVVENETRMKIISCLAERDFLHFRELKRELGIGTSSLKWHLRVLEDFRIIHHQKVGQYEIFFLLRKMPNNEFLDIYFAIISGVGYRVAKAFREMKHWDIDNLAEYLGSSKEAIRYHLKKLEKIGLILPTSQTRFKLNPQKLIYLSQAIERRKKTN